MIQPRNYSFFIPWAGIILFGLPIVLTLPQGEVLLWINQQNNAFLDVFFKYATMLGEEWMYLLLIVALCFIRYLYALFIPVLGALVAGTSFGLKTFFGHPRPEVFYRNIEEIYNQLHFVPGVDIYSGYNSFPSGHTMSGFALFGYFAFCLPKAWQKIVCFILAFLVGFSRMYLFQHFLQDVLFGAFVGVFLATVVFLITEKFNGHLELWYNKKISF